METSRQDDFEVTGGKTTYKFETVVQSFSCVWLFVTPWTAACQGLPVYHQLLEFTHTHVHWVSDTIPPLESELNSSPVHLNKILTFSHQDTHHSFNKITRPTLGHIDPNCTEEKFHASQDCKYLWASQYAKAATKVQFPYQPWFWPWTSR